VLAETVGGSLALRLLTAERMRATDFVDTLAGILVKSFSHFLAIQPGQRSGDMFQDGNRGTKL
jgi:hypothetical protein